MAKFLHIADIHLGFDRYNSPERTKDFFRAFQTTLEQYALEASVDFVLIAGDLFEHRNIMPATLNQAQVCLQVLQEEGIPVLAIEGNHDNRPLRHPHQLAEISFRVGPGKAVRTGRPQTGQWHVHAME